MNAVPFRGLVALRHQCVISRSAIWRPILQEMPTLTRQSRLTRPTG